MGKGLLHLSVQMSVENNMCESFNKTILEARPKPIIDMFEDIRIYVMERMQRKRDDMAKWDGHITQYARKKLEKNLEDYRQWCVHYVGYNKYEVKSERRGYVVDLKRRSCTCRHWELSGIPCCHAIGAIYHIGGDPEDYIHWWYHIDRYKKCYEKFMPPLNGKNLWPESMTVPVNPPIQRRMPGRPKTNRIKGVNEEKKKNGTRLSKKGVQMHCSLCKNKGHNKLSCNMNLDKGKKRPSKNANKSKEKGKNVQGREKLPIKRKATIASPVNGPSKKKRDTLPPGIGVYVSEQTGNAFVKMSSKKKGYWAKKNTSTTQESTNVSSVSVTQESRRSKTLGLTKR